MFDLFVLKFRHCALTLPGQIYLLKEINASKTLRFVTMYLCNCEQFQPRYNSINIRSIWPSLKFVMYTALSYVYVPVRHLPNAFVTGEKINFLFLLHPCAQFLIKKLYLCKGLFPARARPSTEYLWDDMVHLIFQSTLKSDRCHNQFPLLFNSA